MAAKQKKTSLNFSAAEHEKLLQRITELEHANKALTKENNTLKTAEARNRIYREFTDFSTQALGIGGIDGRIIYANQALCKILGHAKPEDAIDTLIPDYYLEEDRVTLIQEILPAVLEEGMKTTELPLVSVDGRITPTRQAIFLIRNDKGEPEYYANVIIDITERKNFEKKLLQAYAEVEMRVRERTAELIESKKVLEQSQKEWEEIFNAIGQPTVILNRDHTLIDINQIVMQETGKSREELVGKKCFEIFHDSTSKHPPSGCPMERMLSSGNTETVEMEMEIFNGTYLVSCTPVLDEHGQLEKIIHIATDITSRKEIEKKLFESEQNLSAIFNTVGDGILVADVQNKKFLTGNQAILDMLNYTEEELLAVGVFDIHPEEDLPYILQQFEGQARKDFEVAANIPVKRQDGSIFYADIKSTPVQYGDTDTLIGVFRDVTQRLEYEKALKDSEERFRLAALAMSDLIYEWNVGDDVLQWFGDIDSVLGYAQGEFPHTISAWLERVIPDDLELLANAVDYHRTSSEPINYEYKIKRKDGSLRYWSDYGVPVVGDDGLPFKWIGICTDITERKNAEADKKKLDQQIQLNKKLESIGILAGGIAHDFNNMLTAIMGNASLALAEIEPDHKAIDKIREIEKASDKARNLTKQLLTFSKGGLPVRKAASIADLIKETACFMLRGSSIACNFKHDENLWTVSIDQGQISQVIQNLVINSSQAMPNGGELIIRAENYIFDQATTMPLPNGQYVKVSVSDQGCGIPEEEITKIFDPYYSTKPNGTGLGLAIVYSIINNHGGHITAESTIGRGTTFSFYLPATTEKEQTDKPSERENFTGSGRILVMDDDASICKMVAQMLERLGFEVSVAKDGQEAIDVYLEKMRENSPFTAVILDLTVPGGIGGQETIKQLLKHDPDVKAFVSSGYADGPVIANYKKYGFVGAIPKPYRIDDLKIIIDKLLPDIKNKRKKSDGLD